jgi:hypothetical protein
MLKSYNCMKNHGNGSNHTNIDVDLSQRNKYKIALVNTHCLNDSQSTKIQQCHNKTSLKASQIAHGL